MVVAIADTYIERNSTEQLSQVRINIGTTAYDKINNVNISVSCCSVIAII